MVYGYFKNLSRRTVPDKVLRNNAFDITKDTKYNGYQRCLASMVCKCFNKRLSGGCVKNENMLNQELAEDYTSHLQKYTHLL